jgi:hypothetical protein
MAINIIQTPAKYSPASNPLFLKVSSTRNNIVYFKAAIKATSNNSVIANLKLNVTPDAPTTANIDLSNILRNYTSAPINIEPTFITSFNSGYLDYYIEVIEMVLVPIGDSLETLEGFEVVEGDTVSITGFTVYNAQLADREFQFYDYHNYYVNPLTTAKFLSSKPMINNVNSWSKEFLYFLADGASTANRANLKVYTATGETLYEPVFNVGSSKLHRLNVSPKNLTTSLGINFDNVLRYEVYLVDVAGNILTEVKTYRCINLPCYNEPVNVVWLDDKGGLSTFTFINPKESKSIQRSTYQSNKYLNNVMSVNGVINRTQKTFNVSQTSNYTLNSPVLNDWEYVYLTDMLSSEQVYVELSTGEIYPIILKTTSADVQRKKYSTSAPRFQFSFEAESNLSFSSGSSQV